MASDKKEIRRVLKEEQSRGKKPPPDENVYKARIKKLGDLRTALQNDNWELFKKQLIGYGLTEGSKEWNDAVGIWNQYHGHRYR